MFARALPLVALAIFALACSSDDGGGSRDADAAEATPDALAETTADAPAETAEDVPAETAEDAPAETTEDVAPETVEDVAPDVIDTIDTIDDGAADADATPACEHACDCPQGERCTDGACELAAEPTFCCAGAGCPEGSPCVDAANTQGLCGIATSPFFGALVFNEVLIDGATDGDPNGDGDTDPVEDEFVEIANVSAAAIDLEGFVLRESTLPDLPRHTFAAGDTLGAGGVVVIFGGGAAPDDLPGARFVLANAEDPGVPFGLSLDNVADALELVDDNGELVATFSWGPAPPALPPLTDESYTRSPDLTGAFTAHTVAAPPAIFSPGRRADGSTFK